MKACSRIECVALEIEDYALIGDCETAALVGKNGSIDWLCWPDFSSPACFASLIGTERNGRWLIGPCGGYRRVTRRYRDHTLILETEFETGSGILLLTDFMPARETHSDIVRQVKCLTGTVAVEMQLRIRFDYGRTVPWVGPHHGNACVAAAGSGAVYLRTQQKVDVRDEIATAEFTLKKDEQRSFVLTYAPADELPPRRIDARKALKQTEQFWKRWCAVSNCDGPWAEAVERSLITLKALTYRPTGGIVAAPTTSLPERFGVDRNWDYRYCWLRDAAFTLESFLSAGCHDEAQAWQEWLLQSIGRDVRGLQIMYGIHGERHLPECELPWLQGYRKSRPVRIGNAASEQLQLDVFGEIADAIANMRRAGLHIDPRLPHMQREMTDYVAAVCHKPASGLWEQRGRPAHYTYSKAMAWLALEHGVRTFGGKSAGAWRKMRDRLHSQICTRGFSRRLGSFVQSYGSAKLDASVLLLPMFGFLPYEDARVRGTIDAIQKKLVRHGLVYRNLPNPAKEQESAFVACSFWLVQNLLGTGRRMEAEQLFEKLLSLRNDVGLLAEEYDPRRNRFMGNFPQALSHIALVNAARMFSSDAASDSLRPWHAGTNHRA
jgi:GH15 family glucan-1,4-alpha-glucosidase